MKGFKQPDFADRQKAAQQAKKDLLSKFRSQPGPDDPEVAKRRAEREAIAANRERLRQEKEAAKAEEAAASKIQEMTGRASDTMQAVRNGVDKVGATASDEMANVGESARG